MLQQQLLRQHEELRLGEKLIKRCPVCLSLLGCYAWVDRKLHSSLAACFVQLFKNDMDTPNE